MRDLQLPSQLHWPLPFLKSEISNLKFEISQTFVITQSPNIPKEPTRG